MRHVLYAATGWRALVQLLLVHDSMQIRGCHSDCPCVYFLIVERLADGISGVKHGVAAFVMHFLEWFFNAATCCCNLA